MAPAATCRIISTSGGFHSHGGPPNGWFLLGDIPWTNGWWLRGTPISGNAHMLTSFYWFWGSAVFFNAVEASFWRAFLKPLSVGVWRKGSPGVPEARSYEASAATGSWGTEGLSGLRRFRVILSAQRHLSMQLDCEEVGKMRINRSTDNIWQPCGQARTNFERGFISPTPGVTGEGPFDRHQYKVSTVFPEWHPDFLSSLVFFAI